MKSIISSIKSPSEALETCIDLSPFNYTQVAEQIGMDAETLYNSIGPQPSEDFPINEILPLMAVCKNTLPLEWLAHNTGHALHTTEQHEALFAVLSALPDTEVKYSVSPYQRKLVTTANGQIEEITNLREHAKKFMGIAGVYALWDANGKRYIGESSNIGQRWTQHLDALENNTHENYKLQRAWNLHGKDFFRFDLLEITEGDLHARRIREAYYVETAETYRNEYNLTPRGWPKDYWPPKGQYIQALKQKRNDEPKKLNHEVYLEKSRKEFMTGVKYFIWIFIINLIFTIFIVATK